MRKLILLISLVVSSFAFGQEKVPNELFGIWLNGEGEALLIKKSGGDVTFQRRSSTQVLAVGTIEMEKGDLLIKRYDVKSTYKLDLFIGNETLVIYKPYSSQAWLWNRIE